MAKRRKADQEKSSEELFTAAKATPENPAPPPDPVLLWCQVRKGSRDRPWSFQGRQRDPAQPWWASKENLEDAVDPSAQPTGGSLVDPQWSRRGRPVVQSSPTRSCLAMLSHQSLRAPVPMNPRRRAPRLVGLE